jgi:hypothetical protein
VKRKIAITNAERTMIVAALIAYHIHDLASNINVRFDSEDPTNDGPEVSILSGKDRPWYF